LDISELCVKKSNVRATRGHSLKLEKISCVRDEKLLIQSGRALECFGSTHGGCIAPSINALEERLDGLRRTRVGFFMD